MTVLRTPCGGDLLLGIELAAILRRFIPSDVDLAAGTVWWRNLTPHQYGALIDWAKGYGLGVGYAAEHVFYDPMWCELLLAPGREIIEHAQEMAA